MADLPTRSDLFSAFRRSVINADPPRINPRIVDVAGSDLNLLAGATSLAGEEVVAALAEAMRNVWVETARGDCLDRVAFDRYGLTRFDANQATVDLVLTRPLPGVATPGIYPQGSRVSTAEGVEFTTVSDAVFGDFDTSVSVAAVATLAGPQGNVSAGSIALLVDAPFDSSISVTNPSAAAGGADAETDPQFRGRIRSFFPTIRRGTLGAIEFGARQVPGVAVAKAVEAENLTVDGLPLPACGVFLYIADAEGNASSLLVQAVQDNLLEYRAAGIPVTVLAGVVLATPVVWNVDFASGIDTVEASEQVRAVTVAVSQRLRPGDTLLRSSLIAAARTIPGVIVSDTSLVVPVGDIIPSDPQTVLRVTPEGVSFQ